MKPMKLAALVLFVVGAALLIWGIYQFVDFRQSFAGKAASFGNRLSGAFGGGSRVADGYVKPIILMVLGAGAGAAGFFLSKKK